LKEFRNYKQSIILHFKRWNNKTYSVFNSIGKVIRICSIIKIIQGIVTVKSALIEEEFPIGYQLEKEEDAEIYIPDLQINMNNLPAINIWLSNSFTRDFRPIYQVAFNYFQLLVLLFIKANLRPFLISFYQQYMLKSDNHKWVFYG